MSGILAAASIPIRRVARMQREVVGRLGARRQQRERLAPVISRGPTGRATGNHWGEALALLSTSAQSPYYFSLHASDPTDRDGGSRKDTGHKIGRASCRERAEN